MEGGERMEGRSPKREAGRCCYVQRPWFLMSHIQEAARRLGWLLGFVLQADVRQ